jgi:hypothetical protein
MSTGNTWADEAKRDSGRFAVNAIRGKERSLAIEDALACNVETTEHLSRARHAVCELLSMFEEVATNGFRNYDSANAHENANAEALRAMRALHAAERAIEYASDHLRSDATKPSIALEDRTPTDRMDVRGRNAAAE